MHIQSNVKSWLRFVRKILLENYELYLMYNIMQHAFDAKMKSTKYQLFSIYQLCVVLRHLIVRHSIETRSIWADFGSFPNLDHSGTMGLKLDAYTYIRTFRLACHWNNFLSFYARTLSQPSVTVICKQSSIIIIS